MEVGQYWNAKRGKFDTKKSFVIERSAEQSFDVLEVGRLAEETRDKKGDKWIIIGVINQVFVATLSLKKTVKILNIEMSRLLTFYSVVEQCRICT